MARLPRPLLLAALLLCCCAVAPLLPASAARPSHPILSSAGLGTHRSKHVRTLEVVQRFHITLEDGQPLPGFHPDAPPVPKPQAASVRRGGRAATTMAAGADAGTEKRVDAGEVGSEFSPSDLQHWSVAGPPHRYHRTLGAGSQSGPGMPQLYPDRIRLHFIAFGEVHDYELHIMRDLYHAAHAGEQTGGVKVYDGENNLIEELPHVLTSYWYRFPDGSGWVTATLHPNGQLQAVVHAGGDTIQLDPVQLHKQEMESEVAYKKLFRAATHRGEATMANGKGDNDRYRAGGMVAFRHSDMPDAHKTHKCGSMRPGASGGNGTEAEMMVEPLYPYTAAARQLLRAATPPSDAAASSSSSSSSSSSRRLLQTTSATTQGYGNFPLSSNTAKLGSGWVDCFPEAGSQAKKLSIGLAVDTGMYEVWGSVAGVQAYMAWQISVANLVYLNQVHIFLSISDVVIQTALGEKTPAWNDAPPRKGAKCPITIQTKLNTFSAWRGSSQATRNSLWSLQTNCYPPAGTVGLAWINVLCNTYYGTGISTFSSNQWLTTAHEFGHNFGAQHTFQLGQGATGGIMDYGDGRLDGIFQFHPTYSQPEMCAAIRNTMWAGSITPYCVAPFEAECGNGVVEPGEACDDKSPCCMQPGSSSPCQLTPSSQCSGESACCADCKFRPTSTTCMGGNGLCQNGFCAASACQSYSGLSYCGTEPNNPCVQRCVSSTKACSSAYSSPNLLIADGVVCNTAPYSVCVSGKGCVASGSPSAPVVRYAWTTSDWTQCSCAGEQTRQTYCTGSDNTLGERGVNCEIVLEPKKTQSCTPPPSCVTYSWVRSAWSTCSVNCGSGIQQASVQCVASGTGSAVADSSCSGAGAKPSSTQSCNTQACPVNWSYSAWSACTTSCGGGISTRTATCFRTQNGVQTKVDNSVCTTAAQATTQPCNTNPCAPVDGGTVGYSLTYGPWGSCSVACGPNGQQTRPAYCRGSDGKTYDNSKCGCGSGGCPGTVQACNTHACASYAWSTAEWGTCTLQCGGGLQTRSVSCVNQATGVPVSLAYCTTSKPAGVQSCNTQSCQSAKWVTGSWSLCSKPCDGGTQSRSVTCEDSNKRVLDFSHCGGASSAPASTQPCNAQACPRFQWLISGWSSCSSWCGGGTQTRSVKCVPIGSFTPVSPVNCDPATMPLTAQYCNTEVQCPLDSDVQWTLADWSSCSSICGGDSVRKRAVLCKNSTTGLEVDAKFCPTNYKPEASSLCPNVQCPTHWHTGSWSPCTAACAGGQQHRIVECRYMDSNDTNAIDESLCSGTRPSESSECNLHPCPSWVVTKEWGGCSAPCGEGMQTREVTCTSWDNQKLAASACAASPLPPTSRVCIDKPCPHWAPSPWSPCDRVCGGGKQTRKISCRMPNVEGWHGQLVEDETLCASSHPGMNHSAAAAAANNPFIDSEDEWVDADQDGKPDSSQSCNTAPCPATYWEVIKWGPCSATCGGGLQFGNPVCKSAALDSPTDIEAGIVASSECPGAPPSASRPCNEDPCPSFGWVAPEPWGDCSVACGLGVQTRRIACANTNPPAWLEVPWELLPPGAGGDFTEAEALCAGQPKLPTVQVCSFPKSVCYGSRAVVSGSDASAPGVDVAATSYPASTSVNGMCTSSGECLCRAGWAGRYCDETPRIYDVLTNGAGYTSGIPLRDVLQITWQSEGSLPYVSILLSRSYAEDPADNWPVPSYVARDIPNSGTFSWPVGEGLPDLEGGEGYVVLVWFSSLINAQNAQSFTVADPCAYKSCGLHGTCGRAGVCECVSGYSGDTCMQGPCERALCSSSYGSCLNEDYIGLPGTTSETVGLCYCGTDKTGRHYDGFQCRSPPDCTPRCKNGADLVNIIVDLDGGTSEEKGQCGTCACRNLWGGEDCDTCELECFNGGIVNDKCSSCDCTTARGYFGSTCSCRFYTLTVRLTLPEGATNPSNWIGDEVSRRRFSRTLATDLALAAGQTTGVNVQVNVPSLTQPDPLNDPLVLEAEVQFGLECPQLSQEVVMGGAGVFGGDAGGERAKQYMGVVPEAQSTQGRGFNSRRSPMTVRDGDGQTASFDPTRPMRELFALSVTASSAASSSALAHHSLTLSTALSSTEAGVTGTAASSPWYGPHPSVEIINGRPTLLSVYNLVASSLEDLSGPFYRGVVTSTLSGARVVSVQDLSGTDQPRLPGEATDPFLSAQGMADGSGGSRGGLSVGAIVGIVIAAIVILLCVVAAVMYRRRVHSMHRVMVRGSSSAVGSRRSSVEFRGVSVPTSVDASPAGTPPRSHSPNPARRRLSTGARYIATALDEEPELTLNPVAALSPKLQDNPVAALSPKMQDNPAALVSPKIRRNPLVDKDDTV